MEFTASEVGDHLLAFFFALVRDLPDARMYDLFESCVQEVGADNDAAMENLFVLAFQTRDCRGGKGERALFLKMLVLLFNHKPRAVLAVLPLISEYGYFKDYLTLLERDCLPEELQTAVTSILVAQTHKDVALLDAEAQRASLSLCAKYLPREGGSFDKHHKALFHGLVMAMHPNHSLAAAKVAYRKLVARLTKCLDVPESKMTGKRFADINFEQVPSVCLKKNRKAFLNELCHQAPTEAEALTGNRHPKDEDRIASRQRLLDIVKHKPEKLKAKQLFPHDVVKPFLEATPSSAEAQLLEAQWVTIRQQLLDQLAAAAAEASATTTAARPVSLGRLVPLVDVSGSMSGDPMLVAITLGILVSEINHPAFRDRFITFESRPSWVKLSDCATLQEKVNKTKAASWGGSTDVEAAFNLIATVVESFNLGPEDIPDLIVFSDMQFDCAVGGNQETQLQRIQRRFHDLGMRMRGSPFPAPRIIFWNLRGDTDGFPAQADSSNVQMLSGFSASLLKAVLEGDSLPTPADTLQKLLSDKRYEEVRKVYRSVQQQ